MLVWAALMMEAAGLVLGAIPLITSALRTWKAYRARRYDIGGMNRNARIEDLINALSALDINLELSVRDFGR